MSSHINDGDVDRLNDQDKAELRQFLSNEQQRSQIQSPAETHHVTELCWKKCVSSNIKQSTLDRSEESCLTNCVDRFWDLNFFTMEHLNKMRN
ncbi:hypothetical protein S7711_04555 [Stachybotrys chartarum IBT 7711]|uniref:Mitochondrial import inner membrane translocase subunit n=1 Tax=Stachybotrys chartarum (strain CBS 109288 / IBT 7711) TaxID=1280523 RepID=A0A084APS4_STACB|nr:hypothetical protein S7711_04555 [Stachybotrys chartarum IBT 7711]KFA75314.1 hypothetical protein S40288_00232 [Stachybotrys chartarum IBT 40288]